MGIQKIDAASETAIALLLRSWPSRKKLTWESLRLAIKAKAIAGEICWSRQSLSANQSVKVAFAVAKKTRSDDTAARKDSASEASPSEIEKLASELAETKLKYDNLLLRHTRLLYNVSLMEGGSRVLDLPLPDNTKSQRG